MKIFISLIIVVISANALNAQQLQGKVVDSRTGAGIPFSSIYIPQIEFGVTADSTGQFSFSVELPDRCRIRVSAATYESKIIEVNTSEYLEVQLDPVHIELEDVVVSTPRGGNARNNAFKIDHLALKELNSIQSTSLTEAISNINGVQQASMGNGISKPVVRGMQGVRVLTMLNGMRIENQQWGGDHGFGIAQLGIDAVEVIKGPSSLLYGPDAFGGVIYLIDAPYSQQNAQEINITSRFESASLGTNNTLSYKLSKGIFRVNLAGLYSSYADYQLPNGKYAANSRYNLNGFKASVGVSKKNWVSHLRYTYGSGVNGVPGEHHHEEDTSLVAEEESPELDFQEREMEVPFQKVANHYLSLENKVFLPKGELFLLVGNTNNNLEEFEDTANEPAMRINLNNSLYSFRYIQKIGERWRLVTGAQGMYQLNRSDTTTEEVLIPSYEQLDNGLFSIAYFEHNKWAVQFGARYDLRLLKVGSIDYSREFSSPNLSAGVVRSDKLRTLRLNIASGFRAPHVSELLSDGVHHSALRYEKGDVDLISEKSMQLDFSYEIHREHYELVVNPFYNYITNYIHVDPTDSVIDGFPVFEYTQTDNASLYGVDAGVHYHPHFAHWLHIETSYSYIRGEDFHGNSFAMVPQARINSLVKIDPGLKWKFRPAEIVLQHQYYFDQTKTAVFENSSRSYNVLNFGINWKWDVATPMLLSIGVKNLLNESYINHLSRLRNVGLTSSGRNYYIALNYTIPTRFKEKGKK